LQADSLTELKGPRRNRRSPGSGSDERGTRRLGGDGPGGALGEGPRPRDGDRLVRLGPGRHRDRDRGQVLEPERPELEVRAEQDREARARLERDDPPLSCPILGAVVMA
jgi:hypothetical protein